MKMTQHIVRRIQEAQLQLEAAKEAVPAQHLEANAAPREAAPNGDTQDSAVKDLRAQLALLHCQLNATEVHGGHYATHVACQRRTPFSVGSLCASI